MQREHSFVLTGAMGSGKSAILDQLKAMGLPCVPDVFDRGMPDLIVYAELLGLDTTIYYNSATLYQYNPRVFWFKGWKDIYGQDEERKMSFQQAYEFGERARDIYRELGYEIIQVPLLTIDQRAEFIYNMIQSQ